jgi:(1->4)-alpha-D-glucan 1-alpha-D-glucosylmutase
LKRYVCIHGHFYQPPRENPWLEAVEKQDSAYPFHDWNERITAECYAANSASRILDDKGRVAAVVNNYARISFNFGPTLLSWLKANAAETYQAVRYADAWSQERFSGHGNALAQAYNHMILPLANLRDKRTQVIWGISDFQERFHRAPEGMWLPETAVDLETLDIMAEFGLRFTILSPHQAKRVRGIHGQDWCDAFHGQIDPSRPYLVLLPSGRRIAVFFYDGPISRAVAFESLLSRGENLVERLLGGFSDTRNRPQLVHIASDGETYGHHQSRGDMALAYALDRIEAMDSVCLTNYGEFLEMHPPAEIVEIFENTSWSCAHGVGRWFDDCGCRAGVSADWNQSWRGPLREAFDWLRDTVSGPFQERCGMLMRNPWEVRDDYITVILDRSRENMDHFFSRHARHPLSENERVQALNLLELERHAMLMYTSCGWFFDELSGIETVQVIRYAGRVVQLAKEALELDLESEFLEKLKRASSNIPEQKDGMQIYLNHVKPAAIDLEKVCAHYAISSVFEAYPAGTGIFAYTVDREAPLVFLSGKIRLIIGKAQITSDITGETAGFCFGVLYLGGHSINCGVCRTGKDASYNSLRIQAADAFSRADYAEVIRLMDQFFGDSDRSLHSLFRDEQLKIVDSIVQASLLDAENVYRQVYENNASLARVLKDLGLPLPQALRTVAEVVLNNRLRRAVELESLDLTLAKALLEEVETWQVKLDAAGLGFSLKNTIEKLAGDLLLEPWNCSRLQRIEEVVRTAKSLPFTIDFWKVQNIYFSILRSFQHGMLDSAGLGDPEAKEWMEYFSSLGEQLHVNIEELKKMTKETESMPVVAAVVQDILSRRRIPCATYRLQLNGSFRFSDVKALVPYLSELGISDLYLSPIMQARPGSAHGYDVCDHNRINPELGDESDWEALKEALSNNGMGLILDLVPNHMGIFDASNTWWADVLENGPSSQYAPFFDIDWNPVKEELKDKVLLPILEDQYGKALENGKFRLALENGSFFIYCGNIRLPVAPRSYRNILTHRLDDLSESLGPDNESLQELESILTAISYLPSREERDLEKIAERSREKEVIKRRIASLCEASDEVRVFIEKTIVEYNGVVGDPQSFDSLDALINDQVYRPAFWRVAAEEINYRRFFDINDLAAICMEKPEVFSAAHEMVFNFLAGGSVTGLRIDHADGLWDPAAYLRQIQYGYLERVLESKLPPDADGSKSGKALSEWFDTEFETDSVAAANWPLYVAVEKILSEGEPLPSEWATSGTTGYDFLNVANGIFVDMEQRDTFTGIYADFIGRPIDYNSLVNSMKKMIMLVSLASEIQSLSHQLDGISERNRRYRDFTLNSITFAVREVIASLEVYRTYISGPNSVSQRDRQYIEAAVAAAKRRNPNTSDTLFNFICDTLLLRNLGDFHKKEQNLLIQWVMKFQQMTSPVMAKSVEDTAFYRFNRLISLNEVGGDPGRFGCSVASFHRHNVEHSHKWPHAMLASTTHDTKRSEDARAAINVLSEMPDEWAERLARWSEMNASFRGLVNGESAPDSNDEYLLYQTLLGAWPPDAWDRASDDFDEKVMRFRERMIRYMHKASKEAKVHTSWVNPNEDYDTALRDFVSAVLDAGRSDAFWSDFLSFQNRVAFFGELNAMSQLLLKLTCPGIPDIYQGSELWDKRLVDPDNRGLVDYEERISILKKLHEACKGVEEETSGGNSLGELSKSLMQAKADGRIKLYILYRTLHYRRDRQDLFTDGDYVPLNAKGIKSGHICSFMRSFKSDSAVVAVARLIAGLTGGREVAPFGEAVWKDTWLPLPNSQVGDSYRNIFTNEKIPVEEREGLTGLSAASVFQSFPVALLEPQPA